MRIAGYEDELLVNVANEHLLYALEVLEIDTQDKVVIRLTDGNLSTVTEVTQSKLIESKHLRGRFSNNVKIVLEFQHNDNFDSYNEKFLFDTLPTMVIHEGIKVKLSSCDEGETIRSLYGAREDNCGDGIYGVLRWVYEHLLPDVKSNVVMGHAILKHHITSTLLKPSTKCNASNEDLIDALYNTGERTLTAHMNDNHNINQYTSDSEYNDKLRSLVDDIVCKMVICVMVELLHKTGTLRGIDHNYRLRANEQMLKAAYCRVLCVNEDMINGEGVLYRKILNSVENAIDSQEYLDY